jgi:hypothetical protein
MTLEELPKDSFTYQSARMAFSSEYMVPIEAAWELEQYMAEGRAMLRKVRRKLRQTEKAYAKYFKETLALRPLPEAAQ